jgi:hypothetical protein
MPLLNEGLAGNTLTAYFEINEDLGDGFLVILCDKALRMATTKGDQSYFTGSSRSYFSSKKYWKKLCRYYY